MSTEPDNTELRILRMVRQTLIQVAKDTQTPPSMRHPLASETIQSIRDCLELIVHREHELGARTGNDRPHFTDEPKDSVVVQLDTSSLKAGKKDE